MAQPGTSDSPALAEEYAETATARKVVATKRMLLRACLAGYDAQYGERSIGDQHKDLPPGAVERVEAVVEAARVLERELALAMRFIPGDRLDDGHWPTAGRPSADQYEPIHLPVTEPDSALAEARERIRTLEAELARLRAVDKAMVERAAKAAWNEHHCTPWNHPDLDRPRADGNPTAKELMREEMRAALRAALRPLRAALNSEEGSDGDV